MATAGRLYTPAVEAKRIRRLDLPRSLSEAVRGGDNCVDDGFLANQSTRSIHRNASVFVSAVARLHERLQRRGSSRRRRERMRRSRTTLEPRCCFWPPLAKHTESADCKGSPVTGHRSRYRHPHGGGIKTGRRARDPSLSLLSFPHSLRPLSSRKFPLAPFPLGLTPEGAYTLSHCSQPEWEQRLGPQLDLSTAMGTSSESARRASRRRAEGDG